NLARPADDATPEVGRAVPLWRVAQARTRIAGAKRAHDHVVQGRRVFEHMESGEITGCPEAGGLQPVDADFFAGGHGISQDQFLELGVDPGPRDQMRGRGWSDLFREFGEVTMILSGENALFYA